MAYGVDKYPSPDERPSVADVPGEIAVRVMSAFDTMVNVAKALDNWDGTVEQAAIKIGAAVVAIKSYAVNTPVAITRDDGGLTMYSDPVKPITPPATQDARELVREIRHTGWTSNNPYAKEPLWDYLLTDEQAAALIAAHDARLLDEAADRVLEYWHGMINKPGRGVSLFGVRAAITGKEE